MYIKETEAGAIYYSIQDLRRDNPDTSFPASPSDETLAAWGVYPCEPVTPPSYDVATQSVSRGDPVKISGEWWESWTVTDLDADAIAMRREEQWTDVRAERNRKLADCDWTQLPDAPVDAAAWATYRQELRDVTQQADPFNITWPIEPR